MIRSIFLFLAMFVAGAVIALVTRAALFRPHADHTGHPVAGGDYAPMVSNALAPANAPGGSDPVKAPPAPSPAAKPAPAAEDHSQHGTAAKPSAPAAKTSALTAEKPVNSVCAICGMSVDPNLPTLEYKGQTIGFGCKMCAPKFKADPDRYGPVYLRNEVIKR